MPCRQRQNHNVALRNIFLIVARNAPSQRAHFAIFIPSASDPERGTLINAVGAPMVGYKLEFERIYSPALRHQPYEMISIGRDDSSNVIDYTDPVTSIDSEPRDNIQRAAAEIPPPRISQNFIAPVNDVRFSPPIGSERLHRTKRQ